MSLSKDLTKTRHIVRDILENDESARNSDMALYIKVCERVNPAVLTKPFGYVLGNRKELGIPPFETVRRTRQKLQEDCKDYSAAPNVEAQRMLNEEIFRDFARCK